ncbi:MAG TPA: zf-HC2 domain-containing protein [Thermoanaerobaculia bacterium]|nr:zf-HC2 domain-containing protein [Thermoanaerobaculia bacterium]
MGDQHPTATEIWAFTRGRCSLETAREVVAHLLRECPPCRAEMARQERAQASAPSSYDAAFERARVFKLPATSPVASAQDLLVGAARPVLKAGPRH